MKIEIRELKIYVIIRIHSNDSQQNRTYMHSRLSENYLNSAFN